MLLVPCPYCGPRPEVEFRCGGEAHVKRPDPATATDQDWAEYLYYRANPKGLHRERWYHVHGCGRWFNTVRDTVSEQFHASYRLDEPAPVAGVGVAA
jgi:sarcosine oxidase subunit delta